MVKNQKPIMMAYIIFLVICVVYYGASYIFKFEFEAWNRIVVGATIASYFFSLNSFVKTSVSIKRAFLENFEERRILLTQKKEIYVKLNESETIKDKTEEIINKNNDMICKLENVVKKHENTSFVIDVFGFLAFFCTITLNPVYFYLRNYQEVYTLLAFIVVLLVEYIEPLVADKTKKACIVLNEVIKREITEFEKMLAEI